MELPELPRAVRKTDPVSFVFLGLALLALGSAGLMAELGLLRPLEALSLALMGLGIVMLVDAAVRHARPWTRHKSLPLALLGSVLTSSGLACLLVPEAWWAVLLICLGLCSLGYGLRKISTRRARR